MRKVKVDPVIFLACTIESPPPLAVDPDILKLCVQKEIRFWLRVILFNSFPYQVQRTRRMLG